MAYPFAAAEVLTAVDLNAMIGAPTQNTQTGTTYTFGLADAGKVNTFDNASPVTATLPAQATVSWPANTVLPVLCLGAGTVTITPAVDVTINGEPLTLETSKGGSLVRTASNTWTFIPFSAGDGTPGDANFTNAATGDYVSGGISYKYITFTGSGELVVDRAGFADILLIGGGGGGGGMVTGGPGGGGAGGYLDGSSVYFAVGTATVVIGAGAPAVNPTGSVGLGGATSRLGNYYSSGGGGGGPGGGSGSRPPQPGGSGGGGGSQISDSDPGAAGVSGLGFAGGTSFGSATANSRAGGGGGGAGAVGANGVSANAGAGGDGSSSAITGASVTRAGGGGGASPSSGSGAGGAGGGGAGGSTTNATAGTINTGGGGGGVSANANTGAGGSGLCIIRVVV